MAVLLQYNLNTSFSPTTVASGIVGSIATPNGVLSSFTRGPVSGYADDISSVGPVSGATSAALAVTNGSYFFVTITPAAGKQMSLTTLTFNMARGGLSTPRGYQVRSSADDFAASLGGADIATQRPNWTAVSIDLSGASFQGVSQTITFNIYVYAPGTGTVLDWDDLTINGTVADTGTTDQEGFRWRDDNGSEATASWLAAQDTDIIRPTLTNTRLRLLINATLDPASTPYQLEYRVAGTSDPWNPIT